MSGAHQSGGAARFVWVVFALVFLAAAAWQLQSRVIPGWVISQAEKALELEVGGSVHAPAFKSGFVIERLHLDWDNRVRVLSGTLEVDYDLRSLISGRYAVMLNGRQVAAELMGDWAEIAGGQKAVFDEVFADLIFDDEGLREINALRAESPTLQFRFGQANPSMRDKHEA